MSNFDKIRELQRQLNYIKFSKFYSEHPNINESGYRGLFFKMMNLDSNYHFSIYVNYLEFLYHKIKND